jgi:hypothetical protein
MELFIDTRLKIGKALLRRKLSGIKRKVFYSNITMVKNIGIVWDASRSEEFSVLSRFNQKMQERNIKVKILGYFPGNELPDQYTAIRFLTCIRKNELDLVYNPISPEAKDFIKNRFEILIDINFNNLFPLTYISSLSNAGFKVGLFEPDTVNNPFDLMMEIKDPVDIESYLNQIIVYLEMINSGDSTKADKFS